MALTQSSQSLPRLQQEASQASRPRLGKPGLGGTSLTALHGRFVAKSRGTYRNYLPPSPSRWRRQVAARVVSVSVQ
ncbi:hypothetical protein LMG28727_07197 [Paraburkholderia kirstenboschensis]|nr:hypothetical protein LMG28727_07197 [Paraburkholderia kirstenboschensis]